MNRTKNPSFILGEGRNQLCDMKRD